VLLNGKNEGIKEEEEEEEKKAAVKAHSVEEGKGMSVAGL